MLRQVAVQVPVIVAPAYWTVAGNATMSWGTKNTKSQIFEKISTEIKEKSPKRVKTIFYKKRKFCTFLMSRNEGTAIFFAKHIFVFLSMSTTEKSRISLVWDQHFSCIFILSRKIIRLLNFISRSYFPGKFTRNNVCLRNISTSLAETVPGNDFQIPVNYWIIEFYYSKCNIDCLAKSCLLSGRVKSKNSNTNPIRKSICFSELPCPAAPSSSKISQHLFVLWQLSCVILSCLWSLCPITNRENLCI